MLFSLLSLCLCEQVQRLNYEQLMEISKTGWTFVAACPSDSFDFPRMTRMFTRCAHLSNIKNANFVILDTAAENIAPEALNISQLPSLLFIREGIISRAQYRGFDEEGVMGFFNNNAVGAPLTINTKEELETVYSEASVALIAAVEGASDETLPNIAKFNRDHFQEVTVYYAAPALFEKPGFYLYRYLDGSLVELADLTGKNDHEMAMIVGENLVPEFAKLNTMASAMYEKNAESYVILMLVMEDFYLTGEQLELARSIKAQTGLNVTYADVENSQILSFRYGLPDSLDSTMAVIQPHANGKIMKFMLTEQLNLENAVKLINAVKAGTADPYWKSEMPSTKAVDGAQPVCASEVVEFVKAKKNFALSFYYGKGDGMEPYEEAAKILKTTLKDAVIGKFSLGLNDWPLEDFDIIEFPYMHIYVEGKRVFEGVQPNTTEACATKLTETFAHKSSEL